MRVLIEDRRTQTLGGLAVSYEIDFLSVGNSNGDSICLRYGRPDRPDQFSVHVVDGAFKDTGNSIIAHIEQFYGPTTRIDHMVLSHADDDHAPGLIPVLKHFEVGALWMNRPWLYAAETLASFHGNFTVEGLIQDMKDKHPSVVELEKIATKKGTPIYEALQGAQIGQFIVLAPSKERYIKLIPDLDRTPEFYVEAKGVIGAVVDAVKAVVEGVLEDWNLETLDKNPPATTASNESSVVQLELIDGNNFLLTADAGPDDLEEAADYAEALGNLISPDFVQIPHHGSRRNVTPRDRDGRRHDDHGRPLGTMERPKVGR